MQQIARNNEIHVTMEADVHDAMDIQLSTSFDSDQGLRDELQYEDILNKADAIFLELEDVLMDLSQTNLADNIIKRSEESTFVTAESPSSENGEDDNTEDELNQLSDAEQTLRNELESANRMTDHQIEDELKTLGSRITVQTQSVTSTVSSREDFDFAEGKLNTRETMTETDHSSCAFDEQPYWWMNHINNSEDDRYHDHNFERKTSNDHEPEWWMKYVDSSDSSDAYHHHDHDLEDQKTKTDPESSEPKWCTKYVLNKD